MRVLPALLGALLITLAVFLFMQSLIQRGKEEGVQLLVHQNVQILHPEPEQEQQPEQEQLPEPAQEPTMEPLPVSAPRPPVPSPATDLEIPDMDFGVGDITVSAVGQRWSAPVTGGEVKVAAIGTDARGFIEVVPYDTRRPNVPEVAWQNKINGWVLVAFSVTPKGKTRGIRVLDARPRGVFEEKVIAAVHDWAYRISFSGKVSGDVVLTQKVEVQWKNYPHNLPNVD